MVTWAFSQFVKSQVGPLQHWPVGPARIPVDRFRSGSWSYQQKSEAVLAMQHGQGGVASKLERYLTADWGSFHDGTAIQEPKPGSLPLAQGFITAAAPSEALLEEWPSKKV